MGMILQTMFACLITLVILFVGLGILPFLTNGVVNSAFLMLAVYTTIPTSIIGYIC